MIATNHDTNDSRDRVDPPALAKWLAGCRNLLRMLGPYSEPWAQIFEESADFHSTYRAKNMLATLRAIQEAVEHNLLLDTEDLILADTFDNLLEQAKYLFSEGYFLAAGVLGRAVLEEHLRKWCQHASCLPTQLKPTLVNYTQELYRAKQFNVAVLKHVESMAAIGNDSAHNNPELTATAVGRLLRDLDEFLGKHSLASSVT